MKNLILICMLMVTAVSMAACGNKKKKAPITHTYRERRGGPASGLTGTDPWHQSGVPDGANGHLSLEGQVFDSRNNPSEFLYTVKGLVNAVMPEEWLGRVNGSQNSNDGTGVFFGGRVGLPAGNSGNISSDSSLLVVVYDEWVGSKDEEGNLIPAVPTYMTEASGTIQGNQANLKFWDAHGWIQMDGEVNGDYFVGTMRYENYQIYDGSAAGGAGELGRFVIRTCTFFVCN